MNSLTTPPTIANEQTTPTLQDPLDPQFLICPIAISAGDHLTVSDLSDQVEVDVGHTSSFGGVEVRFSGMSVRFSGMDVRFSGMGVTFSGIDVHCGGIDVSFGGIDVGFGVPTARVGIGSSCVLVAAGGLELEVSLVSSPCLNVGGVLGSNLS